MGPTDVRNHPASGGDVVPHAEEHGGGGDVLEALGTIGDRGYGGPGGAGSAVFG